MKTRPEHIAFRAGVGEREKIETAAAVSGKNLSDYVRDAVAREMERAPPPMFLIWSWQKLQWWRPARQGYTPDITQAGEYTFDQAAHIVIPHIPPGEEVAVLLHDQLRGKKDYRPPAYAGNS